MDNHEPETGLSFSYISLMIAPIGFVFIPLFARLLDPTTKRNLPTDDAATESA